MAHQWNKQHTHSSAEHKFICSHSVNDNWNGLELSVWSNWMWIVFPKIDWTHLFMFFFVYFLFLHFVPSFLSCSTQYKCCNNEKCNSVEWCGGLHSVFHIIILSEHLTGNHLQQYCSRPRFCSSGIWGKNLSALRNAGLKVCMWVEIKVKYIGDEKVMRVDHTIFTSRGPTWTPTLSGSSRGLSCTTEPHYFFTPIFFSEHNYPLYPTLRGLSYKLSIQVYLIDKNPLSSISAGV